MKKIPVRLFLVLILFATVSAAGAGTQPEAEKRTVRGVMQVKPGAPAEMVEVEVHPVPVNPPSVTASRASLPDDDLVLGVVVNGRAMAYPIRYLALSEVLDDRVEGDSIAPSW